MICGCRRRQPPGCPQGWQRGDPRPLSSTFARDQLTKRNTSPARGVTDWWCSNPADLYQMYSSLHLPRTHQHTCKWNYKNLTFGENDVLCRLQIHKPQFSSLLHRCPSDQREGKSFLEYSLSFCRSAFLPTPKINLSAGSFPFVAQPSLWESLFLDNGINAQPN